MDNPVVKLCSVLVISLSQHLIEIKREALDRIKLKSVNELRKKFKRTDFESKKHSGNQSKQYMSISDFKPLSNIYSSVKIHEQDFGANQFQTKKQQIKQIVNSKQKECRLEDWMVAVKAKMILPEQYPKSQFSKKSISNYSQEAINSIKMFSFDQFSQSNLKKKNSFFTFKEINTMEYRRDCISDSLLNLPDTKVEISIDIFSALLNAGGQNNNIPFPSIWYVWKFIHSVIEQKEDIIEQAYFQVIKQISSKKKIYCQILACLSAIIQPSTRMYLPLLNYVYYQSLDPQQEQFVEFYNFIFFSLIKNFQKPRIAVPSIFEIFCIMNLRKIPLLISFPRQNIFFMQNFSTVEEILGQLIELYGLSADGQYLFSIQGVLLEKGSILDGINKNRKNENQSIYWERFSYFQGFRAFIVLKNVLQINKSPQNFLITFNYIINQYRRGLFLVNNKASYQIGGLIIASELETQDFYEFSLAKYLPRKKYETGLADQKIKKIENNILKQYSIFKGTRLEARKKIISMLSKSKAFMTHFFLCNVFIEEQQYTQAWVGLKPDHFLIIQPFSNRILLTIQFENIRKWGRSSSQLCLKVDDVGDFHIQNNNLDTFISIFTTYLSYLYQQVQKEKQIHHKQVEQADKKSTKSDKQQMKQMDI